MKIKDFKTLTEDRTFSKGDIVRCFRNKCFLIEKIVKNTETKELMMVYTSLNNDDDFISYAMPLGQFLSEVNKEKYPEAIQKYRFEKVSKQDYCQLER